MSKTDENIGQETANEFQKAYEGLKSKILDGSISIEETRQLYEACDKIVGDSDKRVAISGVIQDCLLYTSPSPRDLSTSRMPSSA